MTALLEGNRLFSDGDDAAQGEHELSDEDWRDVQARLNTHEAVCAERYSGINARLKRIEGIFITGAGAIILLLLGVILRAS